MRSEGGSGGERSVSDVTDGPHTTEGASERASAITLPTVAASGGDGDRAATAVAFGRYSLEELIGSGGMGFVYRAYDPMLERPVALKIVRSHAGGEEGQRRLFREAQVLAQVRHPNVVAVHDVGTLGEEVFVAMELVEGTPLSTWQKERDAGAILSAYLQAGRGLAAAHQRGLVHRDVKPSNVLVGSDGRVTVIDFGLAAVDDDAAGPDRQPPPGITGGSPGADGLLVASGSADDNSHSSLRAPLTEVGRVMGTPRYMSPEQHAGDERVDALSDQYSFALALYEALAKGWPFVKDESIADNVDALRLAKERGLFAAPARPMPTHVRRTLQRALAVEPGDRFPSMAALLDELAQDPARTRRRRLVGAAVALSLAFGGWSAIARRGDGSAALCQGAAGELAKTWNPEQRNAVRRAFLASGVSYAGDTFERVAAVLDGYGREWTQMRTEACKATHVHGVQSDKVLDLRMGCLDRKRRGLQALVSVFADQPDRQVVDKAVEASLALGGLAFCADTKALEQEVEPPERPEDRRILAELRGRLEEVNQLDNLGKYRDAEALLQQLRPRVDALDFPPLQAELAYATALTLRYLGKYTEAEPLLKDAIQVALQWRMGDLVAKMEAEATYLVGYFLQRHSDGLLYALHAQGLTRGRGDELEARALNNLATVYGAHGKYAEAEALYKRAIGIKEKALGPDHPNVAESLNNLGTIYYFEGEYAKAEEFHKRAIEIKEKALGSEHPDVAKPLTNLANDYYLEGKYAEAEELYQRALANWEKALGPDHPNVAKSLDNLGNVYHAQKKFAEAEGFHKRALARKEKALGPEHPDVAFSLHNLAACYRDQEKNRDAETLDRRALAIFEKTHGRNHPLAAYPLLGLAESYEKERRFAEALPLVERAMEVRDKAKVAPKERAEVAFVLARVLWTLGKERKRARSLAQEALALYQSAGVGADKERFETKQWLAEHR